MYKLSQYILFFYLLITSECKSDKRSISNEHNQKTEQSNISKQTATYQIFFVSVNNLRVRESPAKSTKVIDKLKESTLIYSNGEVSDCTEKATLRGK
jgi:hypothetical protein